MTYYSVAEQLAAEAESSAYVPTGLTRWVTAP
jgi:hypothetical protein